MVYVEIFNRNSFKYDFRKSQTFQEVKGFLEKMNPIEVEEVVVFNPWTENIYMVKTEKYNFSFKFTIKQFTEMKELFERLNKGEEIENRWYWVKEIIISL